MSRISRPGAVLAILFFAASLTPSLLPRPWLMQGIVSGVAMAAGYGAGVVAAWLWRWLELPVPEARTRMVTGVALLATLALAGTFLWRMPEWQNSIRSLMEMPPVEAVFRWRVTGLAVAVAVLITILVRIVAWLCRRIARALRIALPRRIATALGAVLTGLLLVGLVNGFIVRQALEAADTGFAAMDRLTEDGIERPEDALATGSPASLVAWEDIGRRGKTFIAGGPTREDIAAFSGKEAQRPLRVYVGLNAGDTPEDRAALALRELDRTGAFDRKILIVAVPTGTGWMDPSGVDPVEIMHGGDTAIVATQYSYLPSWMTLLVDPDRSRREAKTLFRAVYDRWTALPHDARPRLYLFGLSLGALGSEASTDLISMLADPAQGALWSGAPFPSTIRNTLTDGRVEGSPEWLPRVRDGSFARFSAQENALDIPGAEWGPLRIVYLQYASDPMAFFSFDLAFSRPDWLRGERGPDVSPYIRWFPLVTMLQIGADLPLATSVPLGYGHNYSPSTYIDGWVAVTDPEDWTPSDTVSLKTYFRQR